MIILPKEASINLYVQWKKNMRKEETKLHKKTHIIDRIKEKYTSVYKKYYNHMNCEVLNLLILIFKMKKTL